MRLWGCGSLPLASRFAPSLCQLKLFGLRHSSGAINRSSSQSKILNLRRSQATLDSWTSQATLSMKQRCHPLQGHKQEKLFLITSTSRNRFISVYRLGIDAKSFRVIVSYWDFLGGWSKTRARMCELQKENHNDSSSLAPHGDIASIQRGFRGILFFLTSDFARAMAQSAAIINIGIN